MKKTLFALVAILLPAIVFGQNVGDVRVSYWTGSVFQNITLSGTGLISISANPPSIIGTGTGANQVPTNANAATLYASKAPITINGTPYATLTAAQSAAVAGNTICVNSGTYAESINCVNGVNWYFGPNTVLNPSIETHSYVMNIGNGVSTSISGYATFTFTDEIPGTSTATVWMTGSGTVSFEADYVLNPSGDTSTDNWTMVFNGAKNTYVNVRNPITNSGDATVFYDQVSGKHVLNCPAITDGFYQSLWLSTSGSTAEITINCPDIQGEIELQASTTPGKIFVNGDIAHGVNGSGLMSQTVLNISNIVKNIAEPAVILDSTGGSLTINGSFIQASHTYSASRTGAGTLTLNGCVLNKPIDPASAAVYGVYVTQSGTNGFVDLVPSGTGTVRVSGTSLGTLATQNGTFSGTTSGLHSGTSSGLNTGNQYFQMLSSTQTVSNTTTLTDSTVAQFTLPAGTYMVESYEISLATTSAAGNKTALTFTGTATASQTIFGRTFATTDSSSNYSLTMLLGQTWNGTQADFGSNIFMVIRRFFKLTVTSPGVLKIQFAQNSATVETCSLLAGSYLSASPTQ